MPFTILFVGGGSLGHVVPSIAVAEALKKIDPSVRVSFVCAPRTDETVALRQANAQFETLPAPAFPRSFSISLITFPFRFVTACVRSLSMLRRVRPSLVFCKGGSLAVPMALSARMLGIPVILHASDSVPSVGDRLIGRVATKILTGFPPDRFPSSLKQKTVQTGNPVRPAILSGSRDAALRITGFSGRRPVVIVMGGSQGSQALNEEVDRIFDSLLDLADVIHLTGQGKAIRREHARYFASPLAHEELPHLLALATVAVSRAGASALSELSALGMPAIIVPLEDVAGDHQLENAKALGATASIVLLRQSSLSDLLSHIRVLLSSETRRRELSAAIRTAFPPNAAHTIAAVLLDEVHRRPLHSVSVSSPTSR